MRGLRKLCFRPFSFLCFCIAALAYSCNQNAPPPANSAAYADVSKKENRLWTAPDSASLGDSESEKLIKYGRELIAHTSSYIGPHGSVSKLASGMNCQNCHLAAGTKPFGNNY